ncbi:hypothetical protein HK104_003054 [Borealophlyctis nickersoniae]|nr:hypothetical protein HK104_003054 [Borealophlyctis nickersoniae]
MLLVPNGVLNRRHFYLAYIIYPLEFDPPSNPASPATTATTQTSPNAVDPRNPTYRCPPTPKYHAVLIHEYDPEDKEATVFICNRHPVHPARYAPTADAPRLQNQPIDRINPLPEGSFVGENMYINFAHPIRCRVLVQDDKISKNPVVSTPGSLIVQLKNGDTPVAVCLSHEEQKSILRLHWRFWNNNRRYIYCPAGESGDDEDRGGGQGHWRWADDSDGAGGAGGSSEGGGHGNGETGEGSQSGGPNWAEIVSRALHDPVVPTAPEGDQLPWLVIPLEIGGMTICGDDELETFCAQNARHVPI